MIEYKLYMDDEVEDVYNLFKLEWVIPVTFDCTQDFDDLRWYPVVIRKNKEVDQ